MNIKYYTKNDPEKMTVSDHLAFDRTILAVERTMLAYTRTTLVSLGAGITLVKLFPGEIFFTVIAWISFFISVASITFGILSYIKSKKRMREIYKSPLGTSN